MKNILVLLKFLLIGNLAFSQTVGLQQHNLESLDDGYVLFAPNTSTTTYLIDKCGKQIKTWPSIYKTGQSCYILTDGTLLRTGNTNNTVFNAGGTGGIVQKIDWDGNVTWSYTVSDATKCQHHDVKALPNGNVLIIAWELKTNTQAIAAGRNPSLVPTTIWSEQILEVQPSGTNGGIIVWEWHLWDHLMQDFDATKPNYGTIASNSKLLNINYNASATTTDWIHMNAIDYNPTLDQIVLSCHNLNEIWIIDHSTNTQQSATHSGGNSGNGGDIIYRWGNPAAYNNGTTADKKLFGQHNAKWIESGYPFENQIMIFNNGIGRPGGNYSTVEIINPPTNGNNYIATLPYLPTTTSWNYNYGNPNNFYAQNISGAQQLSNGNVLLCNGPSGIFTEITNLGTQVWKYINPVNATGVINQGTTPTMNNVFRCTFYPITYSGFVGHDLIASNTIENSNTISTSCSLVLNSSEINLNNSGIKIYPNPTTDFIKIETQISENDLKVELIDALGRTVKSTKILQGSTLSILETDSVYNGIYFVRISNGKTSKSYKVIIAK